MTEENKEETMETTVVIPPPDYKALYFELLDAMEGIGLNIAVQARNQKNQMRANDRPKV